MKSRFQDAPDLVCMKEKFVPPVAIHLRCQTIFFVWGNV